MLRRRVFGSMSREYMRYKILLAVWLASASWGVPTAMAQPTEEPQAPVPDGPGASVDPSSAYEDEEIVVAGQRPRGSVIGNAEPEVTLNGGDIRALGVSDISELLSELGPQLTSARGGQPVVLLEGRRISSFREIATLPAEAIQRAEILPEEVARSYGYSAEQKVLNIVLRPRFKAITVEGKDRIATQGGANQAEAEVGLLTIRRDNRVNINAEYQQTDMLTERQRGITTESGGDTGRSLLPSDETLTLSATFAHTFSDKVSGSLNGELVNGRTFSLRGLSTTPGLDVYTRSIDDLSLHAGGTLNADLGKWHATLTSAYDHDESRTVSVLGMPKELARTETDSANADLTVNGNLYRLPAGDVSLTARLSGTVDGFRSSRTGGAGQASDLDRTTGLGSVNIDMPLLKSSSPLVGTFSVNGHIEHQRLSDFDGLTGYGYGFSWTPQSAIRLTGSFTQTETAPTMQQLGNPRIETPLVPIYDFTRGESVLVTSLSGGNPDLRNARKREWSLGLTLKPFTKTDLTITAGYSHSRIANGVMSLSGLTADIEAAFPDRFLRDGDGDLIQIDTTPINIARQTSGVLRWGINFSKPLKTPQSQIDAIRAAFAQRRAAREAAGEPPRPDGPPRDGADRRGGPGGPGGGGFGGGRPSGRGGGYGGGRLTFALYHTWHLEETARLQAGLPETDLLNGGSLGGRSGQPRHEIELRTGFSRSGIGLRLSGQWQSSARVIDSSGSPTGDLHLADYTTFNLRVFVTPSQLPGMIGKHEWMRGMRVSLAVDNILNTRQKVTDGTGATPYAYQPAYQDPLGRTVTVKLRKLFF